MPAYTLGEIMSQATYNAGRRADIPSSIVSFKANEAVMEVAQTYPRALSESAVLLALPSGSTSTSLPANFEAPILLSWMSGGSGVTMRLTTPGVIDSMGTAEGVPTHFAYFGSSIEYRPLPSSDMTAQMRYRASTSDLVDLDDVPSMSTPWRRAVLLKLEEMIHRSVGNAAGAALSRADYLSYAGTLTSDEGRRQEGAHHQGVAVAGTFDGT